ncbi:MAG: hypothetical protein OEM49_02665 [Myxococcales bacterium]|nr:hypothetical protein [Myxococcales bacterium]MDH5308174.1 hypothetical protein [Myxococcales bacterium]
MSHRSAATRIPWLLVPAACVAVAAAAAIPSAPKISEAVASTNRMSARAEPLLIDIALRIGPGEPVALGKLATHPTGLARLELHSVAGFVERHLLQGDEYIASRDGVMLDAPHPFLPPVFLLQATSGAALAAALTSFGVSAQEVVLGRVDDHDCYVFGGRLPGPPAAERLLPSLWVDAESFDPLRIVRADGVEYRLGPIGVYDGIRLPRWIEIRTQDRLGARLELLRAAPASAPAAAFQKDWLITPTP